MSTIFNQDSPAEVNQATAEASTETTQETSFVETLVGEGRKFKDYNALAKGKIEADAYIQNLEKQMEEMRATLNDMSQVQDSVEQVKEAAKSFTEQQNHTSSSLTEEDIGKLVTDNMTKFEQEKLMNSNIQEVNSAMIAHFGGEAKAVEFLKGKAKELGMTTESLGDIAAKSPAAFKSMIGLSSQAQKVNTAPVGNSVNTSAQSFSGTAPENNPESKEFYDKIRRENPSKYFSPEIQKKIHKLAPKWISEGKL